MGIFDLFRKKIDPELEFKSMYGLQYTFIPHLVKSFNERSASEHTLQDVEMWKKVLSSKGKDQFDVYWNKIAAVGSGLKHNDDYYFILITFPIPCSMPISKAALIVVDRPKHEATYYTLESSFGDEFIICMPTTDGHANSGVYVKNGDLQQFFTRVIELSGAKIR